MRIVTLNTWKNEGNYRRRLALMTEGLRLLRPDVVCLQECFACPGADTARSLAAALGMSARLRPARRKPRPFGDAMVESVSGLAILTREAGLDEAAVSLPSDPRDGERIAQRLDLFAGGRPLRLLNLHLTHLQGEAARRLRAEQLSQAFAWASRAWDGALVVAGDLNAEANDPECAVLPRRGPSAASPTLLGPRADVVPARLRAIDHCLLIRPGGWRVLRRFVALDAPDAEGWRASDHAALVLDLRPARKVASERLQRDVR